MAETPERPDPAVFVALPRRLSPAPRTHLAAFLSVGLGIVALVAWFAFFAPRGQRIDADLVAVLVIAGGLAIALVPLHGIRAWRREARLLAHGRAHVVRVRFVEERPPSPWWILWELLQLVAALYGGGPAVRGGGPTWRIDWAEPGGGGARRTTVSADLGQALAGRYVTPGAVFLATYLVLDEYRRGWYRGLRVAKLAAARP